MNDFKIYRYFDSTYTVFAATLELPGFYFYDDSHNKNYLEDWLNQLHRIK